MLYMGIDVGTQGVRCLVTDGLGRPVASKSVPFERVNAAEVPGWREQDPADWQAAAEDAIRACAAAMRADGRGAERLVISIDGTSGTLVALDADHRPLTRGIMYNDPRARQQADAVHAAMADHERRLGYRFGASFSLPRILWIRENLPDVYEKTAVFAHQADYVMGLLTGEFAVTDYSNALKTGYDLIERRWPEALRAGLGLDPGKLPRVVAPGEPVAPVRKETAARLGLPDGTLVVGGSTDGYASALAAGAVRAGRWASIIGSTFVLKGVTEGLVLDPSGASYSHLLPSGEWLLGGASNIGGLVLNGCADGQDFAAMDARSAALIPTGVRCYPLPGRGERFPFVHPDCEAFYIGNLTGGRLYPAVMEGVAFAERLAYDRMARLGCAPDGAITTAGGASRSELWLRIRASVLGRQLRVPRFTDAAMGSALLAASGFMDGGLTGAAEAMIEYRSVVDPDPGLVAPYADTYQQLLGDLRALYGVEV